MVILLNVICAYDFRADHLILHIQLEGSSLGKTASPTVSIH